MHFRDIGNEDIIARTSTEMLVSTFGVDQYGEVGLYQILITTAQPIAGLDLDEAHSSNYSTIYHKSSDGGSVNASVLDEDTVIQEIQLSFLEDYIYMNQTSYGFSMNTLVALLKGQVFKCGGKTITTIGTNGTKKGSTTRVSANDINLNVKRIYGIEGDMYKLKKSVKDGKPVFKANYFSIPFNRTNKTVAIELRSVSGSGKQNTILIPYYICNSIDRDEDDENILISNGVRISDIYEREDFVSDNSHREYDMDLSEMVVEYVGYSLPKTYAEGDSVLLINNDNDYVSLHRFENNQWKEIDIHQTINNFRVLGTSIVGKDGDIEEQNCLLVIDRNKELGIAHTFVFDESSGKTELKPVYTHLKAVDMSLDKKVKQHMVKIYCYDRDSATFEAFSSL